jgi:hypothetical protein
MVPHSVWLAMPSMPFGASWCGDAALSMRAIMVQVDGETEKFCTSHVELEPMSLRTLEQ